MSKAQEMYTIARNKVWTRVEYEYGEIIKNIRIAAGDGEFSYAINFKPHWLTKNRLHADGFTLTSDPNPVISWDQPNTVSYDD